MSSADLSHPSPELELKRPLLKQPGPRLLIGGTAFAIFSALSTRRALARRRVPTVTLTPAARPPFAARSRFAQQQPATGSDAFQESVTTAEARSGSSTAKAPVANAVAEAGETVFPQAQEPPTPASALEQHNSNTDTTSDSAREETREESTEETENPEEHQQPPGPILALEALSLATVNVFSWAMIAVGAALWSFDIQSMEDLRRKIRGGLGVDGTGRTEKEVEQEVEEWFVDVLTRKEDKERILGEKGPRDEKGRVRSMDGNEK